MKKGYLLKKLLKDSLLLIGKKALAALSALYKLVFMKRTVLFVTNQKIRSITLGPFSQACVFLLIAWVVNLFTQSLRYDELINVKSEEISRLKSANSYFESEFEIVNRKLKKVNEYFASVNDLNHEVVDSEKELPKQPKNLHEESLPKSEKHTLKKIRESQEQMANIQSITQDRITKIENAIKNTGLNVRKSKALQVSRQNLKNGDGEENEQNQNSRNFRGQGGPASENSSLDDLVASNSSSQDEDYLERHLESLKFNSEIDYLMVLERLVNAMPLSQPMKSFYISSSFGKRIDPITHRSMMHHGLDFVGVTHEKIMSPSQGKVVFAGRFSDYGNAVVIDHGFGITTRYGHLSALKVQTGEIVKRGQVIALQGNTGRSTGSHLHYEVRYKNTPLNPKRFLETGNALLNNGKNKNNYVDS